GDVMTDVLFQVRDSLASSGSTGALDVEGISDGFYLATIHRAENTDDPARLREIVRSLADADKPVVLLAHPRVRAKAAAHAIRLDSGALRVRDPLAYPDLIAAATASAGIVTDSGGLQKEAFLLRVPCTTVRHETEWTETVDLGWNVLANTPEEIIAALMRPA